MKGFLGFAMGVVLALAGGGASAQTVIVDTEDCAVSTLQDVITRDLARDTNTRVNNAIRPALNVFRLDCLRNILNFGGWRRLSRWLGGQPWFSMPNIGQQLCRAIIDNLSSVGPEGDWARHVAMQVSPDTAPDLVAMTSPLAARREG